MAVQSEYHSIDKTLCIHYRNPKFPLSESLASYDMEYFIPVQ